MPLNKEDETEWKYLLASKDEIDQFKILFVFDGTVC